MRLAMGQCPSFPIIDHTAREVRRSTIVAAPTHQVKNATASRDGLGNDDSEMFAECFFEVAAVVGMVNSASLCHEQLRLWVVFGYKFDHQPGGEPTKESGQIVQRLVARKSQVMDERQRQRKVGLSSVEDRGALLVLPARGGARIEEIQYQRQKPCFLSLFDVAVGSLDASRIVVKGDGRETALRREQAEIAGIGTQIPHGRRLRSREKLGDQPGFSLELFGGVRVFVVVGKPGSPRGSTRRPRTVDSRLSTSPRSARRLMSRPWDLGASFECDRCRAECR